MTFAVYETSIEGSRAVELFRFRYGSEDKKFTDYYKDVVVNSAGGTYKAEKLQRGSVKLTSDVNRDQLDITAVRGFEIAELFRIGPPSYIIRVDIYRMHLDDPDQEAVKIWTGKVAAVSFSETTCTLRCMPVTVSMKRLAGRITLQRNCPYRLYEKLCGVNQLSFSISTTISAINGKVVTLVSNGGKPDGYFAGGIIEAQTGPTSKTYSGIVAHTGSDITIMFYNNELSVGQSVVVSAGCDHSFSTCGTKFNNAKNYGGFPELPLKNPFEGVRFA